MGCPRESWTSNREARPPSRFSPSDHSPTCWQQALPEEGKLVQAEAQCEQIPTERWLEKSKRCPRRGRRGGRIPIAVTFSACAAPIFSDRLVWDWEVTTELVEVEVDDKPLFF